MKPCPHPRWSLLRQMIFGSSVALILSAWMTPAHADLLPVSGWIQAGAGASDPDYLQNQQFDTSGTTNPSPITSLPAEADATVFFYASAQALARDVTDPSVSVSTSVASRDLSDGLQPANATADVQLQYGFEVVGPDGVVPVHMMGTGTVSTQIVLADLGETGSFTTLNVDLAGGGNVYASGDFNGAFSSTLFIDANYQYIVSMEAFAAVNQGNDGEALSAAALIDPTFTIDPTYASDYSIEFSPGIVQQTGSGPAPVPEPTSLALLGAGIIGMAFVRRPRR